MDSIELKQRLEEALQRLKDMPIEEFESACIQAGFHPLRKDNWIQEEADKCKKELEHWPKWRKDAVTSVKHYDYKPDWFDSCKPEEDR